MIDFIDYMIDWLLIDSTNNCFNAVLQSIKAINRETEKVFFFISLYVHAAYDCSVHQINMF